MHSLAQAVTVPESFNCRAAVASILVLLCYNPKLQIEMYHFFCWLLSQFSPMWFGHGTSPLLSMQQILFTSSTVPFCKHFTPSGHIHMSSQVEPHSQFSLQVVVQCPHKDTLWEPGDQVGQNPDSPGYHHGKRCINTLLLRKRFLRKKLGHACTSGLWRIHIISQNV